MRERERERERANTEGLINCGSTQESKGNNPYTHKLRVMNTP